MYVCMDVGCVCWLLDCRVVGLQNRDDWAAPLCVILRGGNRKREGIFRPGLGRILRLNLAESDCCKGPAAWRNPF